MLCRTANRFFSKRWVRGLLSTPIADHQTDLEGYVQRFQSEGLEFLEEFGQFGDVQGQRILDVGCGLGAQALAVAAAGALEVVGIDADGEKIYRAQTLAGRTGSSGVVFAVQSGSELAFDSGRFDVVLLLDVVEHLPDPVEVLRECARVLRAGGHVLVGFPPYRSPWGGHLFTHIPIPWCHLLFPAGEILEVWREVHDEMLARGEFRCSPKRAQAIIEADTIEALWSCNGMTISRFFNLADQIRMEMKHIRLKTLGNFGGSMVKRSGLREYLVTRVAAVLEA